MSIRGPVIDDEITATARRLIADARSVVSSRRIKPEQVPAITFSPQPCEHPLKLAPAAVPGPFGPVGEARQKLRSGEISCKELVQECLIRVFGDDCNAFAELPVDLANARAAEVDEEISQGIDKGPLHGIPITVKDVLDVAGMPTRAGSDAYFELPEFDAPAVARLREAGAIIIGKTTAHEFALGLITPQSRNPIDPKRIAGGSSGGSAIAVARGMGLASVGTDTRGSIRVPAALCGVAGLKPTYGRIPVGGLVQLSWMMDHIGPIAVNSFDAALMMDVMAGTNLAGVCGTDISGVRLGIAPDSCLGADGRVVIAFTEAVRELSRLTGTLVEVEHPSTLDLTNANAAALVISRSEAASYHRRLGLDISKYWPETRALLEASEAITAIDYLDAQRLRDLIGRQMRQVFEAVDAIAMPTVLVPAPLFEEAAEVAQLMQRNVTIWSFLGWPALTVPCGTTPDGLPVGLQLVAPPNEEATILALGAALEQATSTAEPPARAG